MEPMSYVGEGGESLGYEVELVTLIARELGMELEITQGNFNALMPMLMSGRADIVSGSISITEERKESIDFATAHYTGGVVLLVRAEDLGIAVQTEETGFWAGLADSFRKTFVEENRWQMILSGLGGDGWSSPCALPSSARWWASACVWCGAAAISRPPFWPPPLSAWSRVSPPWCC